MNKYIVTTTIQSPTEATLKFASMNDWRLIVVGDLKTPHEEYQNLNIIYLSPGAQDALYPELSETIGWNCIMRRNLGFIHAYELGANVVASIDDDNIPYESWGKDVKVGQEIEVDMWLGFNGVLDPMTLTNHPELWHRGYPIDYISDSRRQVYRGREVRKILFQADLWDGDPDVDAICRLMFWPKNLLLKIQSPFSSADYIPFNSQNTFIDREALPYYMVLPYVGRADDIWGGYLAQFLLDTRPLFMPSTTYQRRNEQSIQKNLEDEIYGYINTSKFIESLDNFAEFLPIKTLKAFSAYRNAYESL